MLKRLLPVVLLALGVCPAAAQTRIGFDSSDPVFIGSSDGTGPDSYVFHRGAYDLTWTRTWHSIPTSFAFVMNPPVRAFPGGTLQCDFCTSDGREALYLANGGRLSLTRTDGHAFDLFMLRAAGTFLWDPLDLTITGYLLGGGTTEQRFRYAAGSGGVFRDFLTDASFRNLTSVTLEGDLASFPQGDFALSELTVDSPPHDVVPEPASMTLLGTGLVGLIGARRRRRKQEA